MQLENLTSFIGTEVKGLDLREPVSDDDFAVLRETLNQRSVLLFRGQRINESQHVAFSRRFGPLLGHVLTQFLKKEHPEVYVLSNVSENGKPIGNHKEGWNWHSDLSYKAEPSMGALLYALEVPPVEGDTFFASMHAAYDALDDAMKARIRHLTATHSYANYYGKAFADRNPLTPEQLAATPDVVHPLVRTHPETGRKALYTSVAHTARIKGWTEKESLPLLEFLWAHQVKPEFTCRFQWRVGSLAFWDNRCAMHNPINDYHGFRRVMHRITLAGDKPR